METIKLKAVLLSLTAFFMSSCAGNKPATGTKNQNEVNRMNDVTLKDTLNKYDTATFGAGCFWCVEALFQQVKGVIKVTSGYSGGLTKNPSYHDVCSGTTGHAEVCQVVFNPKETSFKELLEVFWQTHDPTTLNRQGNDVGDQYRSVIFYHNTEQKDLAEKYKKELDLSGAFAKPIVTTIDPYTNFYKAEDYHQNYYNLNSDQPYCSYMIKPKLDKFKKAFGQKMK